MTSRTEYNTQTPNKPSLFDVQYLRNHRTLDIVVLGYIVIGYLLIIKFILKLAGICGFCNVNICT